MMSSKSVTPWDRTNYLQTEYAWNKDLSRHYGLFEDGVLMAYVHSRPWWGLPLDADKSYSYNVATRKTDTIPEKDSHGHTVRIISILNYAIGEMEKDGYYNITIINDTHLDTNRLPHYTNPNCRLNKYVITEIGTIKAGELPTDNPFYYKYLLSRPFDIDLYIRNLRLAEKDR